MTQLPSGYRLCPRCQRGAARATAVVCPVCMTVMTDAEKELVLDEAEHKRVGFIVEGTPVPKGRPRFANGKAYTPTRTIDYEARVAMEAGLACSRTLVGPVAVFIEAQIHRGDIDNIAKAILDGMNGVVYLDDKQVEKLQVDITRGPPNGGYAIVNVEQL